MKSSSNIDPKIEWSPADAFRHPGPFSLGTLVPLGAFARVERTAGAVTVNQLGQLPAVTISYNLPDGVALGDSVTIEALKAADRRAEAISTTLCRHGQDIPGFAGERRAC
jgi:HAE1 family hydrophobic/amphiphilic exporter-1